MAKASEVWMIDLGMVAKMRPCLLLTDYPADEELALVTVPTAYDGRAWQSLGTANPKVVPQAGGVPPAAGAIGLTLRLERRLGVLTSEEWTIVQNRLTEYFRL